jgi:hypothetical protein|nr:MAG TPA: hypothetical protein [Caudoviricetes sp.]
MRCENHRPRNREGVLNPPGFLLAFYLYECYAVNIGKIRKYFQKIEYSVLNRGAGGRAAPLRAYTEVVQMSTYEKIMLAIAVAGLILDILK